MIIIEIENDILDMGEKDFTELLTLSSKIEIPGTSTTYTDVKPSVVRIEDRVVLYHYLVYDLCSLNENSNIYI